LFGGIDINYRSVHSGSNRFSGLGSDGLYSSRLGVRGTEELGGGLKANFHLEGALSPDTGLGASSGGFNFQRRSVVGLEGAFGSVVAGRDYTPLFGVSGVVDPFVTNGVGSSYNLLNNVIVAAPTTATTSASTFRTGATGAAAGANASAATFTSTTWADPSAIRMNNAIGYTSPSFSGFSMAAMYGFGSENTNLARDAGTGSSIRLTYAQGPLVISLANQMVKGGLVGTTTPSLVVANDDQKWTTNFLGASYDFGILKLSAGYKTDKLSGDADLSRRLKGGIVGVTAPVGPVVLRASYIERRLGDDKIGTQGALGVSYDLSKRTALYANYAELKNEANYGMSVYGTSGAGAPMSDAGRRSHGLEMGVRHIF
jgi:predicted porin